MAMSDCYNCWETPCSCGWDYKEWSNKRLIEQVAMLNKVIAFKELYPNIKMSENEKAFLDHMRNN
jgi:hypothetical protein